MTERPLPDAPTDPLGAVASLGEPTRPRSTTSSSRTAVGSGGIAPPTRSVWSAAPWRTISIGSRPMGCWRSTTSACRAAKVRAPVAREAVPPCGTRLRSVAAAGAYEVAGRLLAEAADTSRVDGVDITPALDTAARAEGLRLADEIARPAAASERDRRRGGGVVVDALEARGFEPARMTTARSSCRTARSTNWPASTQTSSAA